jgi:type II secretory pathway component PulC
VVSRDARDGYKMQYHFAVTHLKVPEIYKQCPYVRNHVAETAMNEFLNTNWQEVFDLMSPSVTKVIATELGAIFNGILAVVPFDEVFPETLP